MTVPFRAVIAALFVQTLWGANTVAIKIGLEAFPPLWSAFYRFLLGAICILLWAKLRRVRLRPDSHEWTGIALGAVMFMAQIATLNIGVDLSTGMQAAVLMSTFPIFAAAMSHFFIPDDRLTLARSAGLCIAFTGVAVILTGGHGIDVSTLAWGNLVTLLSAALLGSRQIFNAKLVRRIDPFRVIFWQMVLSLPVFALAGGLTETITWESLWWRPLAGMAYQGVIIAGFGFMIMAHFLKLYSPSVIMSFGFVGPISGVFLSGLLLSEPFTWPLGVGMLAVASGLTLTTRSFKKTAK
jgi:drug/metabolite transporter (DMT)-like permease